MPVVSKNDFPLGYNKDIFKDLIDSLEIADEGKSVLILTYIRTDRSNEIVCAPNVFEIAEVPDSIGIYKNLVLDTVYTEGKNALVKAFEIKNEEGAKFLAYSSMCFPVGTVVTSDKIYVVSNVIISTKIFENAFISLNEGVSISKIDDIEITSPLEAEVFKSMIKVKEGEENA